MKSRTFPRTMCELPRIVFAQEFQLGKIFQELVTHTHTHTVTHPHTHTHEHAHRVRKIAEKPAYRCEKNISEQKWGII